MFKHQIDDQVVIETSGETGKVIGRAEYANAENSYLIRYRAVDGRAVQLWWEESAIASAK